MPNPEKESLWGFKFLGSSSGGAMSPEEQERVRRSFSVVALAILCLFALLFLRLWFLQLVQGENLRQRSEQNRLRLQDLPPWRGMILDHQSGVLVANRPSYELVAVMEDVTDIPVLARRLAGLLKLDQKQISTQLENARTAGQFQVRIRGDLTWEELAQVATYQPELPGALVQVQPKREYRQKGLAAHTLGYLGEITEAQLKSGKFVNYKAGDYMGRCGVELAWDKFLRGARGYRRFEVDAYGREFGQLDSVFPTAGANISLTLDTHLQKEAEACLDGMVGAIVALDPRSGKVLALASSPTFSQEAFERGLTNQEWQRLLKDKNHPLENRPLRGQYPPGSTFKIVMAVAGLEENVITPDTIIDCSGSLAAGNHVFNCWSKRGHGKMNLHKALVESCDVYFYTLGKKLGIDRIAKWSRRFGLGQPSGLNLDKEALGTVPSTEWKKARFKQGWHEGETFSASIGQGYNLVTPMQMAQVAAAIANQGIIYQPQLVEKVESPTGEILFQSQPVVKYRLGASPATLAAVQKGLEGVVEEAKGTGKAAFLPNIQIAGKTGTAQVVTAERLAQERQGGKQVLLGNKYENHAWFVGYAPADNPRVAVAVLLEHGGHGGSAAGPVARRVITAALAARPPQVAKSE
ncbi:MAG: penicillin-binding protein 2 [Deltaproteobacteria bacterium]|nr:penicillin-binding protein 2 [Deltaproteobacteria bacterium]